MNELVNRLVDDGQMPLDEAERWCEADIDNYEEIIRWFGHGWTYDDAESCLDAGFAFGEVDQWISNGLAYDPDDAAEWIQAGIAFQEVVAWREAMPELNDVSSLLSRLAEWEAHGFDPADALGWAASIHSAASAAAWRESGFSPQEANEFDERSFTPKSAAEWHSAGMTARQALQWEHEGVTADSALEYHRAGLPMSTALRLARDTISAGAYADGARQETERWIAKPLADLARVIDQFWDSYTRLRESGSVASSAVDESLRRLLPADQLDRVLATLNGDLDEEFSIGKPFDGTHVRNGLIETGDKLWLQYQQLPGWPDTA